MSVFRLASVHSQAHSAAAGSLAMYMTARAGTTLVYIIVQMSSSSSLYFAKNKNIIFNNTTEIQLAGRQKKHKVHEAGAHVIHKY